MGRFLAREIGFLDIARACRAALDSHTFDPKPTLDDLWKLDAWARREVALEILSSIWAYVLVALGLGLVIFIHELGHFLVAKRGSEGRNVLDRLRPGLVRLQARRHPLCHLGLAFGRLREDARHG